MDDETSLQFVDGAGTAKHQLAMENAQGWLAPELTIRANSNPVSDTNPLPVHQPICLFSAGTNNRIVTGGTSVIAISGPCLGAYIANPEQAADQGIGTIENLYVDPVNDPSSVAGSGNGTSASLDPGQSWSLPCPIPAGTIVRVNAVTSGHKFTVIVWK